MSKPFTPLRNNKDRPRRRQGDTCSVDGIEKVLDLAKALTNEQRCELIRALSEMVGPGKAPQAGKALATIAEFLPLQTNWSVADIKKRVVDRYDEVSEKEIYNALAYLKRKGRIQRVGYGQYVVNGMGVVTSDDLGMEPGIGDD